MNDDNPYRATSLPAEPPQETSETSRVGAFWGLSVVEWITLAAIVAVLIAFALPPVKSQARVRPAPAHPVEQVTD